MYIRIWNTDTCFFLSLGTREAWNWGIVSTQHTFGRNWNYAMVTQSNWVEVSQTVLECDGPLGGVTGLTQLLSLRRYISALF